MNVKMERGHLPTKDVLEGDLPPTAFNLQEHGNTGVRCTGVGVRQIALAANHNSGMLRLNATHHDDDDETELIT